MNLRSHVKDLLESSEYFLFLTTDDKKSKIKYMTNLEPLDSYDLLIVAMEQVYIKLSREERDVILSRLVEMIKNK